MTASHLFNISVKDFSPNNKDNREKLYELYHCYITWLNVMCN